MYCSVMNGVEKLTPHQYNSINIVAALVDNGCPRFSISNIFVSVEIILLSSD